LYGIKHPDWVNNLHAFGEIAVVHDRANSKFKHKLKDKGKLSMFVGYPPNHAGEVSQFLNLATKKLIISRTAIFLHKSYGDYYNLAKEKISTVPQPDTDEDLTYEDINIGTDASEPFQGLVHTLPEDPDSDTEEEDFPIHNNTISQRGLQELQNLQTFYNPQPMTFYSGGNCITVNCL
jgi:hypothetical protein